MSRSHRRCPLTLTFNVETKMNNSFTIEVATVNDTDDIQKLIISNWQEFLKIPNELELIQKRPDLQNPSTFYSALNGAFWVAKSKTNEVIASIGVHEIKFQSERVGMLRRFVVSKQTRSNGIGSELLQYVENYSSNKGWKTLMFGIDETMEKAKKFYLRRGYREFSNNVPQELLDDNDTWYLLKEL